jgi:hypothetical protein
MRNTADVKSGKPTDVLLQSISGLSAINPLAAFYESCYSFILSRIPHETNSQLKYQIITRCFSSCHDIMHKYVVTKEIIYDLFLQQYYYAILKVQLN